MKTVLGIVSVLIVLLITMFILKRQKKMFIMFIKRNAHKQA